MLMLRMARYGTKKRPFYHIVATDSRAKRDGRCIEQLGVYDPLGETKVAIDAERAKHWLGQGAQVSPAVKRLLKRAGVN